MSILKIKSFIYRKTGVYLAHKEELEYITSKEFWKTFLKIAGHEENDMAPRDIQGLLIGMWQADHRFVRRYREGFYETIRRCFKKR